MARPALELADIFRRHGPAYRARHRLPLEQLKPMRAIETCRTAALGGHVERCGHCAHQRIAYNSCRNRHCPKCQSKARLDWLAAREGELLPVDYYHVVFTLPPRIAALALQNKKTVYDILFRASAEAMLTIARDPRHLGADIGFFSILHTWGQNLLHHPHVHCVATGGGLDPDGERWIHCKKNFFLSVRVLSRLFRGLFLRMLGEAKLRFHGELQHLNDPTARKAYLARVRQQDWVVYAKAPFGGAARALAYLGRYTHRIAISNHRLLQDGNGQVSFHYKDYASSDPQRQRVMTLGAEEFLRRFLLHVLPPGFQRIRHYGLLANRKRHANLALCRELLKAAPAPISATARAQDLVRQAAQCPRCGQAPMLRVIKLAAIPWPSRPP
jgi:hypothetical protein